jgi:hypothetical protein
MVDAFRFRNREIRLTGPACIEWTYHDAQSLTDAVWLSDHEIFCLRRRPAAADLLVFVGRSPEIVLHGIRVLGMAGRTETGLFLNTGQRLLRQGRAGFDPLYENPAGIASFDVSDSGRVACVVGDRPGYWRAVVIRPNATAFEMLDAERVLRALWSGEALILLCAERRHGIDGVVFRHWDEHGLSRELFRTDLSLRAETASRGSQIAVAGGVLGGAERGIWVFDPRQPPPYEATVGVVPAGWMTFVRADTVAFSSLPTDGNKLIVAGPSEVHSFSLGSPGPRQIAASPTGVSLAWARPDADGGSLTVCGIA